MSEERFPCPFCKADMQPGDERCVSCGREPVVSGGYRVRGLLGRGGMGAVLAAERTGDRRPVAVKVMWLGDGVDWKAAELFERSTKVLQGLRHPALPEVLGFERDEHGTLILVRDRFDGGSLGERIREGRPRLDRGGFRRLLEELLGLLSYLHAQVPPVLHRDIKPDNILFRAGDDWHPVLVDFDTVAAPGPQSKRLTVVCTPGYTAPEQLAGDPCPASDLYSLGATMLFVATGTEPDELPRGNGRFDVERRLSGLDPQARDIVLRLVEPSLTERFATADEALDALRGEPRRAEVAAAVVDGEPSLGPRAKSRRETTVRAAPPAPTTREVRKAAKEARARMRDDRPDPAKAINRKKILLWTGAVVGGIVGFYLLMCIGEPSLRPWVGTIDAADGTAEFANFRRGEENLLVGVEKIHRTEFLHEADLVRLTRLDPQTGKILGRTDVGHGQWALMGYGDRVLWLADSWDCRFQARDPWTGALLTDSADVVRRNPGFQGRLVPASEAHSTGCYPLYSPGENGNDLLLRTRDGTTFRLAPDDWTAVEVADDSKRQDSWRVGDLASSDGFSYFQLGTDFWKMEGDDRRRLVYENRATGAVFDPLPGSDTFLGGGFVCWDAYCNEPITVAEPDGFLVLHRSGIDVHHSDMLTRITRDGRTRWTFMFDSVVHDLDDYNGLFALSDRIVLVLQTQATGEGGDDSYATWLIGLDPATGRSVWTYRR